MNSVHSGSQGSDATVIDGEECAKDMDENYEDSQPPSPSFLSSNIKPLQLCKPILHNQG